MGFFATSCLLSNSLCCVTRAALCFYWSCPTHGPHVLYYTCSLPHGLLTFTFATALPVHFCCREKPHQFEFLIQTSSPTTHIQYYLMLLDIYSRTFHCSCRIFLLFLLLSTLNNNSEEVFVGGERGLGGMLFFLGGGCGHLCLGEEELSLV